MVEAQLAHEELDGQTYWFSSSLSTPKVATPTAFLLPGFDEYLLGYRDRSAVLDPAHAKKVVPGGGMFKPIIVINGRVVGTWKGTLRKTKVVVNFRPFVDSLSPAQVEAVAAAADSYSRFPGLPVEISH